MMIHTSKNPKKFKKKVKNFIIFIYLDFEQLSEEDLKMYGNRMPKGYSKLDFLGKFL